jgi:hypothetical protein
MTNNKSLWEYIISKNHIIPSRLANKFGIPVLRTIVTNLLITIRRLKNCRPISNDEKTLLDDGIVVIPNFLPEEEFQQLKNEINETISKSNNVITSNTGSTKINSYPFLSDKHKDSPAIQKFTNNKKLTRLIAVAEGLKNFNEINSFGYETSLFGDPQKDNDNNIAFHADIHFHSHKVLYYMDGVSEDEGPFAYCFKSHKNNFKRLWFEFKKGQLDDAHKDTWRIEDHLDKKFFNKYFQKLMKTKRKITAKPNTLIITNVHGFHQRGEAVEGTKRSLIRIAYRYNPLGSQKILSPDLYSGSLF